MPSNDALRLFVIFLIIPSSLFIIVTGMIIWGISMPLTGAEAALIFLLHLSLSLAYIASYPAAQAESPSLYILLMIASAREKMMTSEEIIDLCSSHKLITDRLGDLINYTLIQEKAGTFELKPVARLIIKTMVLYRRLLGLPLSGG